MMLPRGGAGRARARLGEVEKAAERGAKRRECRVIGLGQFHA